jgi:Eco57I restriction-modification methylase/MmeI, helicase spacer domain
VLANLLGAVRQAEDLAAVFEALGYGSDRTPFGGSAWIVGRWRGFRVVAEDAEGPARDVAARLARTLGRGAHRGLAVAVAGRGSRELALAAPKIAGPGTTRVLCVPLDHPAAEVLHHLGEFRPKPASTGLAHALRIDRLLATEIVSERFFSLLRIHLDRMTEALGQRGSAADRRLVVVLALTRVLFLYFVQAKGWLDGRADYLRTLLDDHLATGRSFHRDALNTLFFDTLNRPVRQRRSQPALGAVPYLNGGLFERHPAERRLPEVAFTNEIWQDALDDVFERFRFCVREAHEVDAIAPDMLGRVFERVMDVSQRQDTGTFYTPEAIVTRMVDATLEAALAGVGGLPRSVARAVVEGKSVDVAHRHAARRALDSLRVLDPAVGSGAFLLGALHRITDMMCTLDPAADRPALRRSVLHNNLFGVDLHPVAVRLAELRLWLAVVADDPTTDVHAVAPLPNLDGIVRQGDSLLDPIAASPISSWPSAIATRVRQARQRLFDCRGADHARRLRTLRRLESRLAAELLRQSQSQIEASLAELSTLAGSPNLFGHRSGLTAKQRARVAAVERRRTAVARATALARDGAIPFFSYDVHAPDVMRSGGFSVVLGNPPWVRAERLSAQFRTALGERFSWWRSGGRGESKRKGYAHQPDLSVAFLQRSVELAAPGAAIGLLLPSKIATAAYGTRARAHLVRETTIRYLHRIGDGEAAGFGATTYPLAMVVEKRRAVTDHKVGLQFDGRARLRQRSLGDSGPWILVADGVRRAIADMQTAAPPLSTVAPVSLGVKTGANALLMGRITRRRRGTATVQFGCGTAEIEETLLRPVLRGRDVQPFAARTERVLIWAYDSHLRPLRQLPPLAKRHLEPHLPELRARADYRDGPPWQLFRLGVERGRHRVVWPDIARRPRAVVLETCTAKGAAPLNSCYVASLPSRRIALVVAGVLNSTWAQILTHLIADEANGGYRRINARVVGSMPIPTGGNASVVAEHALQAHHGHAVSQHDLDEAVAAALALTPPTRERLRRFARDHL